MSIGPLRSRTARMPVTLRHCHEFPGPAKESALVSSTASEDSRENELSVRRVRNGDRQAHLGRSAGEESVEGGEGRDSPVDSLWCNGFVYDLVLPGPHIEDGGRQHLSGVFRPLPGARLPRPHELNEGHHVAAIRPASVLRLSPVHPGLEDGGNREGEGFDALAVLWRNRGRED